MNYYLRYLKRDLYDDVHILNILGGLLFLGTQHTYIGTDLHSFSCCYRLQNPGIILR